MKLANGATQIARVDTTYSVYGSYVAAFFNGAYVTWAIDQNNGGTYLGHYFQTQEAALADLAYRASLLPKPATEIEATSKHLF